MLLVEAINLTKEFDGLVRWTTSISKFTKGR